MGNLLYQIDRHIDFKSSVSSTNKLRILEKKKKKKNQNIETKRDPITIALWFGEIWSLIVDWRLQRLAEANFWAITAWTLRLCKRNFLLFSFSIWRDLVKWFYFFFFWERLFKDQVILILLFLFGSLYQLILLLPFGLGFS